MSGGPPRRRVSGTALGVLAVAAVVLGVVLVVTGGDGRRAGPTTTVPRSSPRPTLPLTGSTLTVADVEELAGVDVPDGAADFLSARLDDQRQLDVTFTLPPEQEATLLAGSQLPAPVEGQRVVTHSSPLWELNPGAELRGTSDERGDVRRAVELLDEDGRVRVRLVVTPAG